MSKLWIHIFVLWVFIAVLFSTSLWHISRIGTLEQRLGCVIDTGSEGKVLDGCKSDL